MDIFSTNLLVLSASSVITTLSILCILVGYRRKARQKEFKYMPADERSVEIPDTVLEEEAAIYNVSERRAEELRDKLATLIEEQKPYLDPNLTIETLAATLGTNKTTLSKIINDKYEMNFRQMLNSCRIKEALDLLSRNPDISMRDLRTRSGFNSVSTFTSSFFRFTGFTPGEYCKRIAARKLCDGYPNGDESATRRNRMQG